MSLERKIARHGKRLIAPGVTVKNDRPKALKKGTPYRRLIEVDGRAVHATKGKGHPLAILEYRAGLLMRAAGVPQNLIGAM